MMDGSLTHNYEDNMNGEPDAVKVARPVRKGIERKGLVTVPRSQSTLHPECVLAHKKTPKKSLGYQLLYIKHIKESIAIINFILSFCAGIPYAMLSL
jgi:hypothetical protein